jgi:hypothetical protein
MAAAEEFRRALKRIFQDAQNRGLPYINVGWVNSSPRQRIPWPKSQNASLLWSNARADKVG